MERRAWDPPRIRAQFHGLFRSETVLCVSHGDTAVDENGATVELREGMAATAFDEDGDAQGNRNDLIATGVLARAPEWLEQHGSRWVLLINSDGVRHESEL